LIEIDGKACVFMKDGCFKIADYQKPKTSSQKILLYIEDFFNKIFTPGFNPLYYLGAISSILYAVIVVSGIYLFIFYRTNNPYQIVQNITEKQWYAGGVMRSIHRYASDGLIIALFLHVIREYLNRRYSHSRWLAWVTGLALLIITIIIGITGYWLVWDERAQLAALKTSNLLNDIRILIEPISMSFLNNEGVNVLLFFILHLVHLAMPFAIIILIGLHVFRHSRPVITTPKMMTYAILIMLFAAAVIMPAKSAPPADLSKLTINAPFDWFYLFIFPLRDLIPKQLFWIITAGITLLLLILPWTRRHRLLLAEVILKNCTGCEQCNKDCPFEAIRMRSRTDGLGYRMEATVISERCVSCGICVGACDFEAINLPEMGDAQIKKMISKLMAPLQQADKKPKILLFICAHSASLKNIIDINDSSVKGMANVKVIAFPCIGMVQPSMIEAGLETGADGVFLCGCLHGDCHFREGNTWLHARMKGKRLPFLKKTIDHNRILEYQLSPINTNNLFDEMRLFEEYLSSYNKSECKRVKIAKSDEKKILKRMIAFSVIPLFFILFFSRKPIYPFYSKDDSLIKFAFKYTSRYKVDCKEATEKETEAKLKHMRKTESPFPVMRMNCTGERIPVNVELFLDDKNVLTKTYHPSDLKRDGTTYVYEEIITIAGKHRLKARITDSKTDNPLNYTFDKEIQIKSGEVAVIDLTNKF
jgi:coenzyme F420-reducing hydrogenase delta subunit/Pyruvate/2-oxoacid:ferredoxin oxidoreductase delta subunit